eukprot:1469605-Rhodomonas_salina.1
MTCERRALRGDCPSNHLLHAGSLVSAPLVSRSPQGEAGPSRVWRGLVKSTFLFASPNMSAIDQRHHILDAGIIV